MDAATCFWEIGAVLNPLVEETLLSESFLAGPWLPVHPQEHLRDKKGQPQDRKDDFQPLWEKIHPLNIQMLKPPSPKHPLWSKQFPDATVAPSIPIKVAMSTAMSFPTSWATTATDKRPMGWIGNIRWTQTNQPQKEKPDEHITPKCKLGARPSSSSMLHLKKKESRMLNSEAEGNPKNCATGCAAASFLHGGGPAPPLVDVLHKLEASSLPWSRLMFPDVPVPFSLMEISREVNGSWTCIHLVPTF